MDKIMDIKIGVISYVVNSSDSSPRKNAIFASNPHHARRTQVVTHRPRNSL